MIFVGDVLSGEGFHGKKSFSQVFRETDLLINEKVDRERKVCHKVGQGLTASANHGVPRVCGGREKQKIKTIKHTDRQRQLAGFEKIFPGNIF